MLICWLRWEHRYGTYTWANGDVYEGQWLAGTAHGRGRRTNKNGVVIQGEWRNGKVRLCVLQCSQERRMVLQSGFG